MPKKKDSPNSASKNKFVAPSSQPQIRPKLSGKFPRVSEERLAQLQKDLGDVVTFSPVPRNSLRRSQTNPRSKAPEDTETK